MIRVIASLIASLTLGMWLDGVWIIVTPVLTLAAIILRLFFVKMGSLSSQSPLSDRVDPSYVNTSPIPVVPIDNQHKKQPDLRPQLHEEKKLPVKEMDKVRYASQKKYLDQIKYDPTNEVVQTPEKKEHSESTQVRPSRASTKPWKPWPYNKNDQANNQYSYTREPILVPSIEAQKSSIRIHSPSDDKKNEVITKKNDWKNSEGRQISTKDILLPSNNNVPTVFQEPKVTTIDFPNNTEKPTKNIDKATEPKSVNTPQVTTETKSVTKSSVRRAARRTPIKIVPADHYRRHAKKPGFLYIARNDAHCECLYKIGYTTLAVPEARIDSLNKEHGEASDIGEFRLIHHAPVAASYDAEQALFDVLAAYRVTDKREFFYGQISGFIEAMNVVTQMNNGTIEPLNKFYPHVDERCDTSKASPVKLAVVPTPACMPGGGWVYVCQNIWHEQDTYRLGFTSTNPINGCERLNKKQKLLSSQIGFYYIVYCIAVNNVKQVQNQLRPILHKHKIGNHRKNFYRLPLQDISSLIERTAFDVPRSSQNLKLPLRKGWLECQDCFNTYEAGLMCLECN
ncbi:hypothetical protein BH11PSE12_BH11PSE12_17300 [soil metagenome]